MSAHAVAADLLSEQMPGPLSIEDARAISLELMRRAGAEDPLVTALHRVKLYWTEARNSLTYLFSDSDHRLLESDAVFLMAIEATSREECLRIADEWAHEGQGLVRVVGRE